METTMLIPIEEAFEPVSADNLSAIETALGQKLPDDYRDFLATFGRCGFPGDAAVVTDAGRFPIFTFYGAGCAEGSLLQQLMLHPDLRDIGVLPVADDLFNNLYVLDFQESTISRLDYSSGRPVAIPVATTFDDLLSRIEVIGDVPT